MLNNSLKIFFFCTLFLLALNSACRSNTSPSKQNNLDFGYQDANRDLIKSDSTQNDIEPPDPLLSIELKKRDSGLSIRSLIYRQENLLTEEQPELFILTLQNIQTHNTYTLNAESGWDNVAIDQQSDYITIRFTKPQNTDLPIALEAVVRIDIKYASLNWNLSVSGLGDHYSLITSDYPRIVIKVDGRDHFFVPYYHGKIFNEPLSQAMDYSTLYPRGWSGTMPFMAYYNQDYGLYFGMHDPKASIKSFSAKANNDGILVSQRIPIPNKTNANNNWDLSGNVSLQVFQGDWYDAAQIYRQWVFSEADYRPIDTNDRRVRQKTLGNVAVWVQESVCVDGNSSCPAYTLDELESHIREFKTYMDIPVGVAWTSFNGKEFDTLYPEIFPARDGLIDVIKNLKSSYGNDIYISGYMNGMLYDVTLASYPTTGVFNAVKDEDGNVVPYSSQLTYMCPAAKAWQDIMIDSTKQMTVDIGFDGAYVDMVTASGAKECFDPAHHHPLGGGSFWRDGYKRMFEQMHAASKAASPYISEEANDFMIDEVDGFLTIGFVTANQVPALSAVYGGKVQMLGTDMGWNDYKGSDEPDSQRFYGRVAQSFVFGAQLGRFWMGLVSSTHERSRRAAAYIRQLGRLRSKLKDFMSFGQMLRPLRLKGNIPTLSFAPYTYPNLYQQDVSISAIQSSVWTDGTKIALFFVNGKVPETTDEKISFSFDFNASAYGLEGESLTIKTITEDQDGPESTIDSNFTKELTLGSYQAITLILNATK